MSGWFDLALEQQLEERAKVWRARQTELARPDGMLAVAPPPKKAETFDEWLERRCDEVETSGVIARRRRRDLEDKVAVFAIVLIVIGGPTAAFLAYVCGAFDVKPAPVTAVGATTLPAVLPFEASDNKIWMDVSATGVVTYTVDAPQVPDKVECYIDGERITCTGVR